MNALLSDGSSATLGAETYDQLQSFRRVLATEEELAELSNLVVSPEDRITITSDCILQFIIYH
jgi:hypothetical protein